MQIIFDILLSLPIGLAYSIFFHKLGEILNADYEYNKKLQRNLILAFIGGIFGLIVVILAFGKDKIFYNRAVKYGLVVGSMMLLVHTLIYNWNVLENDVKLFSIISSLIVLIWYAYYYTSKSKKSKKNKKKYKIEYEKEETETNTNTNTNTDTETEESINIIDADI
jgi:Ca2+/Na+ antiporter